MKKPRCRIVLGCPGAGKSTFLAQQARKLESKKPLLLSFTRSAARVIESKLNWGKDAVKTIHAHCYREIGVSRNRMLSYNQLNEFCDSNRLPRLKRGYDVYNPETHPLEIYAYHRTAEIDLFDALQMFNDSTDIGYGDLIGIVRSLDNFKKSRGLFEFDDLLSGYEPGEVPKIIMIDEAQDLSPKLMRVIEKMVTSGVEEIWMVGDPYQSIYTYTGSDPDLMYHFGKDVVEYLDQSHRCPGAVVEKALEIFPDSKFKPTQDDGKVTYTSHLEAGSEMTMCRTNYLAYQLANMVGSTKGIITMHKAKGLQAENVTLLNSQTSKVKESAEKDPEAEKRVLFTAITRAKKNLTILEGDKPYDEL